MLQLSGWALQCGNTRHLCTAGVQGVHRVLQRAEAHSGGHQPELLTTLPEGAGATRSAASPSPHLLAELVHVSPASMQACLPHVRVSSVKNHGEQL